ncbi:hypothetical protein FRUB_08410 [Fimbriiglobus ruber]|uniref:Serine protease n=1 Tax=Fimbriiglobus ruber TaxID=1908690 RepID=A0A225DIB0_9BACT|nr:hypothetical protein FRUB_08410 [Fimbriiglobus ruber]
MRPVLDAAPISRSARRDDDEDDRPRSRRDADNEKPRSRRDDEDDRPRSRRDDDEKPRKPAKKKAAKNTSKFPVGLVVGGVAGAGLLIAAVIVLVVVIVRPSRDNSTTVASSGDRSNVSTDASNTTSNTASTYAGSTAPPAVTAYPSPPPPNHDTPDQAAIDKCKNAAVYIEVEDTKGGGGSGSGWFGLEQSLIFTNAHVIGMKAPGSPRPAKVTAYINPGTPDQREIPHERIEILAVDRDMDLAMLRVLREPNLPTPLRLRPSRELRDLEKLIALGFPGGRRLSARNKSSKPPAVTVTATNVSSLRQDDNGNLYSVQVQGGIVHGNSGGPIVDTDGNVTAVAVRVDLDSEGRFTNVAYGVPTEYVMGLLAGRLADIEFGQAYRQGGKVHVPVTANCLDPFNRLRAVGVGYWVGDASSKPRPAGTKRVPGAGESEYREAVLNYNFTKDKQTAAGELIFPDLQSGRAYWAQPFYSNALSEKLWLAGNPVKLAGPPIDRVAADLYARYQPGTRRPLTLTNTFTLDEHEQGEGEDRSERVLVGIELKANEQVLAPRDANSAAVLQVNYDTIKLRLELGTMTKEDIIPKEKQDLLNSSIKRVTGYGHVDKAGEISRVEATMPQGLPGGDFVRALGEEAMETLMMASVRLPNARVEPLRQWNSTKTIRIQLPGTEGAGGGGKANAQVPRPGFPGRPGIPKGPNIPRPGMPNGPGVPRGPGMAGPPTAVRRNRTYDYQQNVTYTYLGSRTRGGVSEGVIRVDGVITAPNGGSGIGASGQLRGYAYIDLASGIVLEAEIDKDFEIDTTKDGVKKRVSGINTYKLSRTATP